MDLQKYRLFVDLAETGNLTRTGERVGYTQSGVSRFLKNLERELGFALFTRTSKGLVLTAAGQTLLPSAKELLRSGEQLEKTIQAVNSVETGSITIGVLAGISVNLLPAILQNFRKTAPNVLVKTKVGGTKEIDRWIHEGGVDFGLCTRCSKMEWFPLWEEELLAVLEKEDALGKQRIVSLHSLLEKPLVLLAEERDKDIRALLDSCEKNVQIRSETTSEFAVLSMVKSGLGCGILPELIFQEEQKDVNVRPLDPPVFRQLGICMLSEQEAAPASQKLIACIRAFTAEQPQRFRENAQWSIAANL